MSPLRWNASPRSMSAAARSSDHVKSNHPSAATTTTASKDTDNIDNDGQQSKVADWRTWFSSHEYDDAWSSYRPLDQQQAAIQNNNNSDRTPTSSTSAVGDILVNFNSWTRRRHGMNLEPLKLLVDGNVVDHHEDNDDNEENEEEDGSSSSSTSKLQKRIQWIDTQTRFTIQMLNDLYYTGIRRQMDRPTTERCHRMIGRLVSLTPRPPRVGEQQQQHNEEDVEQPSNINVTGAAQRGNAILERMEWCSPAFLPQLRKWQQQQQRRDGLLFNFNEDTPSSSTSSSSSTSTATTTTTTNYQNKVQQHLIQSKQSIPSPTLPIYNMVLLLYSKEYAPSKYICEQAEDVVWSMIVRGLQLEEFYHEIEHTHHHDKSNTSKTNDKKKKNKKNFRQILEEDKGVSVLTTTPMYPTTQHWNGVLQCWSNSSDPNRAFYAYKFFKCWLEWNEVSLSGSGGSGSSSGSGREGARGGKEEELISKDEKEPSNSSCCDLETFHLMLKACVVEESDTFDNEDGGSGNSNMNVTEQRAKEVGSRVAIGLWKEIRDHADAGEITLTSYTYHQLLRALCQTPDSSKGSLSTMAKIYQRCRIDDMETIEITNLVRDAMTETQFEKLLRGSAGG
jgi:hypothetical protein